MFESQIPKFEQKKGEETVQGQQEVGPVQEPQPEQTGLASESEKQESEEKIKDGFARELERTPKHGFLKKLQKIAGAFALAGIMTFSAAEEASAPTKSMVLTEIETAMEKNRYISEETYQEILEYVKETGGIPFDVAQKTVYKPGFLANMSSEIAFQQEKPFYNRPEVILGRDFIKENPEQAKDYLEKISHVMKASVRIEIKDKGKGSGVVVEYKGEKFVVTNAHVCIAEPEDLFFIILSNKNLAGGRWQGMENQDGVFQLIAKDEVGDIAIFKINESAFDDDFFKDTESLELETKTDYKPGEKIASVGNPGGFPFAVSISKIAESRLAKEMRPGRILTKADPRFQTQELYLLRNFYIKGDAIPGMSGGPVARLEENKNEKPKLAGIICESYSTKTRGERNIGISIPAKEIRELLEKSMEGGMGGVN